MPKISIDKNLNSLSVTSLTTQNLTLNTLNIENLTTTNITATDAAITTLTSTTGNITTVNATTGTITTINSTTGNITTINSTTGTITTINATTGNITTINATTGNITTVNSTTVDTTNLATGLLGFTPYETLTTSTTASATTSLTYVDGSAGGVLTITLPAAPPANMLKMIVLREGAGVVEITGTGLSASVIVTTPNEGALFEWNDDINEWTVISGPITPYSPAFSGAITVDPLATTGPSTFNTITAAINALAGEILQGCTINVVEGTYDEGDIELASFKSTVDTLSIIGDTRAIVGVSYPNEIVGNTGGVTSGGTGTVTITGWGTTSVEIVMSTENPNFETAGLVDGDRIFVTIWSGGNPATTEHTLSDISGNTFTVDPALPALPTPSIGQTITILPNRILQPSGSLSNIFLITNCGVSIQGFQFDASNFAQGTFSLTAQYVASVNINNCVFYQKGVFANFESVITLPSANTAVTVVHVFSGASSDSGYRAFNSSAIYVDNAMAIGLLNSGFSAQINGVISGNNVVVALVQNGGNNSACAFAQTGGLLDFYGTFANAVAAVRLNNYGRLNLKDTATTLFYNLSRHGILSDRRSRIACGDIDIIECTCSQGAFRITRSGHGVVGTVRINPGGGTIYPTYAIFTNGFNLTFTGNAELEASSFIILAAGGSRIVGPALINTGAVTPTTLVSAAGGALISFDTASNTLTSSTTIICSQASSVQMPLVSIDGGAQTSDWISCIENSYVDVEGGTAPTGANTDIVLDSFGKVNATSLTIAGTITPNTAEDLIVVDNSAGFLGTGVKL